MKWAEFVQLAEHEKEQVFEILDEVAKVGEADASAFVAKLRDLLTELAGTVADKVSPVPDTSGVQKSSDLS